MTELKIALFADGEFWRKKDGETSREKPGENAALRFEKMERNIE
ncbi:hypothetical protein [Chryseobacterium sp. R2A-55]|nr:hypothetical protein [Chryseobacterium sp. R2A-55]